ncbi:MAG: TldD/PmbA family protein, partial [Thermodesulfobacteria bacterium]|nr:TldD/PmbA family protein [Thermodesulfobacteriota bacterium]
MIPTGLDRILSILRGKGLFADLYFEETESTYIVFENDRPEKIVSGIDAGVGLRTIYGNFHTA